MGVAIFGVLVWLVALGFVFDALKQRWHAQRVKTWPTAPGVIVSNQALKRYVAGGPMEVGELRYSFEAAGRSHTGKHIRLGDNDREVYPQLSRYPVGRAVTVYYRARQPQYCALETAPRASRFSHTPIGTALFVAVQAAWMALASFVALSCLGWL